LSVNFSGLSVRLSPTFG